MSLTDFCQQQLNDLENQNLYRSMKTVDGSQGVYVDVDGKRYLNFCSNDYLGLASDERLIAAAKKGLDQYGFGSGASRLVCGNMTAHQMLEQKIAGLKKAEDCVVFSSGYMANVGLISALIDRNDLVFSDRLNHASIVDGITMSRAKSFRYKHNDMEALCCLLKKSSSTQKKWIITDSVFSMDGDVADLKRIAELAKEHEAHIIVDEAHGFGVLGQNGGGLVEELGLQNEIDLQMGTLSKAAGCFGAYVCGSKSVMDYLRNKARSLIYTTGLPPSVMSAAIEAINIISRSNDRRQKVLKLADDLRQKIKTLGFDTLQSTTPIIPVVVGNEDDALNLSQYLWENNIWVSAIRPPTVPKGSARLRLTVTANHDKEHVDSLINVLKNFKCCHPEQSEGSLFI